MENSDKRVGFIIAYVTVLTGAFAPVVIPLNAGVGIQQDNTANRTIAQWVAPTCVILRWLGKYAPYLTPVRSRLH